TGREIQTIQLRSGLEITQIALSRDGAQLFSLGNPENSTDLAVKVWDVASGQELRSVPLKVQDLILNDLWALGGPFTFSRDGALVTSWDGKENIASVWQVASGRQVCTLNGCYSQGRAFSPDGRLVVTGASGGTVVWELPGGRKLCTISA